MVRIIQNTILVQYTIYYSEKTLMVCRETTVVHERFGNFYF